MPSVPSGAVVREALLAVASKSRPVGSGGGGPPVSSMARRSGSSKSPYQEMQGFGDLLQVQHQMP